VNKNERIPGEFITTATVEEILISAGIQLVQWAHDIAFTDAAFGEAWAVESANRMASLSELLNVVYKSLPRRTLVMNIDMPPGMIGQVQINPDYKPDAEKPASADAGDSGDVGGSSNSIGDLPF
jgi:hypothetical protein